MRILHTADWHLGKILGEYSLLDDQRAILNQILDIAKEQRVDAIVMAGDLYDRSLPSKDAVRLLDEALHKIHHELNIPFFAIAGNHDSPERVNYASSLLKEQNVFLAGQLPLSKVDVGEVSFYLLPYVDPVVVKQELELEVIDLNEATKALINTLHLDKTRTNVAVYHGYVVAGQEKLLESESERPLTIGTTAFVDAHLFDAFDYVALGHLHNAQKVTEKIAYSGSILKYSKSESRYTKSVSIVDLKDKQVTVNRVDLTPVRDVLTRKGTFDELIASTSDEYVFFELTDTNMQLDAMTRLKRKYPYAMGLEYTNLLMSSSGAPLKSIRAIEQTDLLTLFEEFYTHHKGQTFDDDQKQMVVNLLKESDQS